MRTFSGLLPAFSAFILGSITLLVAAHAEAHAFLDQAEPTVGGTVKSAPVVVVLAFSERLEAGFSSLKVFDTTGKEVDKKDVHLDPKNPQRLRVSLPSGLAAGTYKVEWRAVSADTHVTKGDFTFRVET